MISATIKTVWNSSFAIDTAKVAAEVAKKYIEKAYDAGRNSMASSDMHHKTEWLKDNGVTE